MQGVKLANPLQPNTIARTDSSRPWDVPPGMDPVGAHAGPLPLGRLYSIPYQPAIDAQGNADCQRGQEGYPNGPLSPGGRYGAGEFPSTGPGQPAIPFGGNRSITINDYPILSGGTFKSRQLGINNVRDVP